MIKRLASLLVVPLPWRLKRWLLARVWGYELAPTAYIGWSYIFPGHLVMRDGAYIGHLNVAIHLARMECGAYSVIGRSNWITGHPVDGAHFSHRAGRDPSFNLGDHAALTKSHLVDCTDRVEIGAFTTVAGYQSQFITHGIDLIESRQDCQPIRIGAYCLVGSRVTVIGGAVLPDRSQLAAASLLNKPHTAPLTLYAGQPAVAKRALDPEAKYFHRTCGFVD